MKTCDSCRVQFHQLYEHESYNFCFYCLCDPEASSDQACRNIRWLIAKIVILVAVVAATLTILAGGL